MMSNDERTLDGLVTAGWANASDGDVESPTGHFALIDLTTEREAMAELLDDDEILPDPAWYVVIVDTIGNRYVESHRTEGDATIRYNDLERAYLAWHDDDNNDDED